MLTRRAAVFTQRFCVDPISFSCAAQDGNVYLLGPWRCRRVGMSYEQKAEGLANAIVALVQAAVDDPYCYRSLIDNLHAYRVGAVNRTGKWDIHRIKHLCRWTVAARAAGRGDREHVVPMASLLRLLMAEPALDASRVMGIVDRYCLYCIVSRDEHGRLNRQFQRSMPPGFWQQDCALYMNPWARYEQCAIVLEPLARSPGADPGLPVQENCLAVAASDQA